MMYKNNFVVVVKCNGQILREQGSTVYLPYGSEYSILLKNKDTRKASVGIEVDGRDALNGNRLIIGGNSTEEVKGFMRNMRKTNRFKFIKKTREIQKHRGDKIDDGLIRVTYRFEKRKRRPEIHYYEPPKGPIKPYWGDTTGEVRYTYDSNTTSSTSRFKKYSSRSVGGYTGQSVSNFLNQPNPGWVAQPV